MLTNALLFLLKTLCDLLTLAFLLRFYFQLTRISFQNQAAQIIVTLTNFAVKPMRRIMTILSHLGLSKLDVSTLLLAYLTQLILVICTQWLQGLPFPMTSSVWLILLTIALISSITLSLTIFLYAVLIQAILSWVNPHTPIAPILNSLTHPILRVFRKFIPLAGNIDLSPLVFIIAAQLLLTTILMPLENSLFAML